MANPVVSVVIPVYNAERFLKTTLESVFAQTFKDHEVICVNDGSTDGSLKILEQYGSRLKILVQPNAGPSVAKNNGARHARGQYLSFLDADDVCYLHKLEQQTAILDIDPEVVLVHCNFDIIDERGAVLQRDVGQAAQDAPQDGWVSQLLGPQAWILPSLIMVRREAFERIGGFDADLDGFDEEADLCLRLRSQGRFVFIKEAGLAYRQHLGGRSKIHQHLANRQFAAGTRFYCKLERHFANDPRKLRLVRLILASKYSDWGWHKVRTGEWYKGLSLLGQAISYDPFRFRTYSRLFRSFLPSGLGTERR